MTRIENERENCNPKAFFIENWTKFSWIVDIHSSRCFRIISSRKNRSKCCTACFVPTIGTHTHTHNIVITETYQSNLVFIMSRMNWRQPNMARQFTTSASFSHSIFAAVGSVTTSTRYIAGRGGGRRITVAVWLTNIIFARKPRRHRPETMFTVMQH